MTINISINETFQVSFSGQNLAEIMMAAGQYAGEIRGRGDNIVSVKFMDMGSHMDHALLLEIKRKVQ